MLPILLPSNLKGKKKTLYGNDGATCKQVVVTSSCDWEPVQGKSFEIRQQSRIRRGRLNNLLAVTNSSTIGERAICLAVTSGGLLAWLYSSAGESKSRAVKHNWTMCFYLHLPSPLPPCSLEAWFHCRALVYNKMTIASFICSPFKAPSLLCWNTLLSEQSMPTELQLLIVACCIISYKPTAQNYRVYRYPGFCFSFSMESTSLPWQEGTLGYPMTYWEF